MSGTLVQGFYEMAKLRAESPALGLDFDGAYHDLPWWFVKSKAKHFGMGLLEAEAKPGEYFYLLASRDPAWIYAEIGARTVGLKTLPLPPKTSPSAFEVLFRRFPPAFLFAGDEGAPLEALRKVKGFRKLITLQDEVFPPARIPSESFRRLFNAGIRCEAKHHAAYRQLRESARPETELSPIQVDWDGLIREIPLCYSEVETLCDRLSQALGKQPLRRLLAQADLSRTLLRISCLYWPLQQGAQAVLLPHEASFGPALKRFQPEVLYAPRVFLKEAGEALSSAPTRAARSWTPSGFRRFWRLSRLRRRLHLSAPRLLLHEPRDGPLAAPLRKLDLSTLALESFRVTPVCS